MQDAWEVLSELLSSKQTILVLENTNADLPLEVWRQQKGCTAFQDLSAVMLIVFALTRMDFKTLRSLNRETEQVWLYQIMKGEKDAMLSVPEMADLLFNDTSASHCYASHKLLNEDRTFFKQVGRLPPKFAARQDADVQAIKGRQAAELKVYLNALNLRVSPFPLRLYRN